MYRFCFRCQPAVGIQSKCWKKGRRTYSDFNTQTRGSSIEKCSETARIKSKWISHWIWISWTAFIFCHGEPPVHGIDTHMRTVPGRHLRILFSIRSLVSDFVPSTSCVILMISQSLGANVPIRLSFPQQNSINNLLGLFNLIAGLACSSVASSVFAFFVGRT